jgi:hypothetical protein
MNDIPDIAPMAEAAEEKRRRRFGDYRGPQSATIRPYDQLDIRLGAAALDNRLKLGLHIDLFATVREIFDAAGMISSRTGPRPPNAPRETRKKEGDTNGSQPLEAQ